ncbi:MAG: A24 family peptidase [Planctomycetaceae bacterium]|nr:A24 family peptidase [Planctomycetaceae bacterium]
MDFWTPQHIAFVVGMLCLTSVAAYTDLRYHRIKNWLTIPFFAAGWIYQFWAHGPAGLLDGFYGFLLGFGTYFALWMVAGGGGGDTKLMGAISVWLGFKLTLYLMIVSTLLVVLDSAVVMLYTIVRFGFKRFKKQYLATGKTDAKGKPVFTETEPQRRQRRVLPFAVPLAMAAWIVMLADATVVKGGQLGPKQIAQAAKPPSE